MPEEVTQEEGQEEQQQQQQQEEVVVQETAATAQARAGGWVPKEEWVEQGNDPSAWVDEHRFNERGELYRTISNQSKKIKALNKNLDTLAEHNRKIGEIERAKALTELKARKTEALENQDFAAVTEIDEQIQDVKSAEQPTLDPIDEGQDDTEAANNQAAAAWALQNSWYNSDMELRNQADIIAAGHKAMNPDAPMQDTLNFVTAEIRRTNPQKFQNVNNAPGKVEGGTPGKAEQGDGGESPLPKMHELDADHQKIARELTGPGGPLKYEELIAQWRELGEV